MPEELILDYQRRFVSESNESCHSRKLGIQIIKDLIGIYDVSYETAVRAIALYDRVLCSHLKSGSSGCSNKIFLSHAFACFLLGTKLYEALSPSISDLVRISFNYCHDDTMTEAQILQSELDILSTVDWDVNFATGMNESVVQLFDCYSINRT